ncbi:ABC transporter ATP-binding protein [Pseudomonas sp. WN033]|nr:ABC transporter ATP-binding protein [Pseudomonas sp. WN033]
MSDRVESGPALLAQALCQRFAGQAILNGLSFEVEQGEALCLLGHNGVGKTTTLNHFLGFHQPLSGFVRVMGLCPQQHPLQVRRLIGYVPEDAALYAHLNALENIDYFLAAGGQPRPALEQLLVWLEQVGFPLEAARRPAAGYSKGMRQKVVLALALAKQAKVLLLDEPTTGLDPRSADELAQQILDLKSQGVAVLAVTHDLLWAHQVADHLGIMQAGRLQDLIAREHLQPHELADRLFRASGRLMVEEPAI